MESTNSVRVLYILELAELKFIFFFSRVYLILLNCVLNWLEEFLENISARRSAITLFSVILWFDMERCFSGIVCFLPAIFQIMSLTF